MFIQSREEIAKRIAMQEAIRALEVAFAARANCCTMTTFEALTVLEGMYLRGIRTEAGSAVAVLYLARMNAYRLRLIGKGFQAFFQAWGISQVRPIKHLVIYDASSVTTHGFAKRVCRELLFSVGCSCSPDEVAASSDIPVKATDSCGLSSRGKAVC